MIQLTPQMRILVAVEPQDFRRRIDGMARICKETLASDPFSGTAYVFRNRRGTAVKVLVYDGQGFWLCHKRLSKGKFGCWPRRPTVVKARLIGICQHRGLDLSTLPVHLITAPALRLDRERDQARLRDSVAKYAPRLLILDPFVRLHRIDENDAGQVSALLGYLRELSRAHDLAVLVVHHARKNGTSGQPGNSLRGSGDFFAWADSLLYLRRHRGQLLLTIEHRGAPAPDPLGLTLRADADVHLELIDAEETPPAASDDAPPDGALDSTHSP